MLTRSKQGVEVVMLVRCKTNPGENWGVDFVFDLGRVVAVASSGFAGGCQVQLEGGGGAFILVSVGLEELLALWKRERGVGLEVFGGPVEKKVEKKRVVARRKR